MWLKEVFILIVGFLTIDAKNGCPPGCVCGQSGVKEMSQYRVLSCDKILSTPLPPLYTSFKAKESPPTLSRAALAPMMPTNIRVLDLCESGIERIDDNALGLLMQLTVLKLTGNAIREANVLTFLGCKQLREIYLDRNELTTLGRGCFTPLLKLRVLYLQNNHLKQLPEMPMSVNTLDISNNLIGPSIENYQFQPNIKHVDLCGNPLSEISSMCFARTHISSLCTSDVPKVEVQKSRIREEPAIHDLHNLTLSAQKSGDVLKDNSIKQIEKMHNLQHLAIVSYKIPSTDFLFEKTLDSLKLENVILVENAQKTFIDALAKQASLERIEFTRSPQLASILLNDGSIWQQMGRVTHLGLRDCAITSLGQLQGHGIKMQVDVSRNPLHCDCALVRRLGNDVELIGPPEETVCSTPEVYRTQLLTDVIDRLCQDTSPLPPPAGNVPSQNQDEESEPGPKDQNSNFDVTPISDNGSDRDTEENMEAVEGNTEQEISDDHPPEEEVTEELVQPEETNNGNDEDEEQFNDNNGDQNISNDNTDIDEVNGGNKDEEPTVEEKANIEAKSSVDSDNPEWPQGDDNVEWPPNSGEAGNIEEKPQENEDESNVEELEGNREDKQMGFPEEESGNSNELVNEALNQQGEEVGEEGNEGSDSLSEHPTTHFDENEHYHDQHEAHEEHGSETTYIIIGVIIALTIVASIVFSVLFFYFRRRGHVGIESSHGHAQYRKEGSSKDYSKK